MYPLWRAILTAGVLLASSSLALAEQEMHQSPLLVDPPIPAAAEAAPAATQAPSEAAPERTTRSGRRRSRAARARDRRVARAAAELTRRVDPFSNIRHLTIGSVPAPLPPSHDGDAGSAVATLEAPPPGEGAEAPASSRRASAFEGAREAASHSLAELLAKHAFAEGVPVALARAVVRIESGGNARASNHGALGLMQIKWATARAVGFSGPAAGLLVADTNLRFGMKVLAQAYRDAHGDVCGALMRYQSGHLARHPSAANRAYCAHARAYMARD